MARNTGTGNSRGFTIIELIVVLALVVILASLAMVQYRRSIIYAKEAVLLDDLTKMREAIDQYYADKNQYPPTLTKGICERFPRIRSPSRTARGRKCLPSRTRPIQPPAPASSTSRAVRMEPLSTAAYIPSGRRRPTAQSFTG
jgi:prepilin-type N-terminal cleavage/methylation domain-containing protein